MFKYKENKLLYKDQVIKKFDYEIKSLVEYKSNVIICLKIQEESQMDQNVYALNQRGEIIWQVPKMESIDGVYYVGLSKQKDKVRLNNCDGTYAIIDIKTGKVISTLIDSLEEGRPW